MKTRTALWISGLLILSATAAAQPEADSVAAQIEKAIHAENAYLREHGKGNSNYIAKDGSHEFWSNGGPLVWLDPNEPLEVDEFEVTSKDIEVIELAEGVAVALFYNEGSLKPKGQPAVPNYHTRVMAVFVEEDGHWKVRARHFSPAGTGAGTSSPAE